MQKPEEEICFDIGYINSSVFDLLNLKIVFIFQVENLKRQLEFGFQQRDPDWKQKFGWYSQIGDQIKSSHFGREEMVIPSKPWITPMTQ